MRIVYFANNKLGLDALTWLRDRGAEIVGLVGHPPEKSRFGDEIIARSGVDPSFVFDGSRLREVEVQDAIRRLRPDIGLSVMFGYILRREIIDLFPHGCVNIHPALLPYNRGAYPNVWSIVDRTPAGVTIHYIDVGVDTGDVIAQREVPVEVTDTGGSLYGKLESTAIQLLMDTWPSIEEARVVRQAQPTGSGTHHNVKDVEGIDPIDLDKNYRAGVLIDILRARTFPPYRGAYFIHEGRKVYLRLDLHYD